ncbi:MAG: MFS transporter [Gemmataceae bacterium]
MQRPWYEGAERGQWLALAAALLGWTFDGFEQGVFPIVARPALISLLQLSDHAEAAKDNSLSEGERESERQAFEKPVRQWNGILTAAFLIGAALGGFVFGWIGDRVGRVRAMVFSVLTYALFTGGCGLVQHVWQLMLLRFLAALGMGGEWALGVALVMESWSAHARPVLAGLIGAAANLGFLIVSLIGTVINPEDQWRVILLLCVLPALMTFLFRMYVPESKQWEQTAATGPRPGLGAIFTPGLRRRSLLGAGIGAVALLATWGAVQWIALWVGQARPGSGVTAQICSASGAILGSFFAAVWVSRLLRRWGYALLCIMALAVCEFLFLKMDPGKSFFSFLVMVFFVGACSAAFYGWLPLYLPELFPTRVRATGQGFCYNAGRCLAAVGVLLTTFVIDLKGNYAQPGALVCLIYVVGIVLAWFIPETKGQPLPE